MKALYTLVLSAFALGAFAQSNAPTGTATMKHKINNEQSAPSSPVKVIASKKSTPSGYYGKADGANDFRIGTTKALNQSNGSIYRRVQVLPGNTISATWTTATDPPSTGNSTRGSGYNHYDGSWGAVTGQRIEPFRTGFPSIALGPDNKEIIFSHRIDTNGLSGGLVFNRNQSIGSTTWTSNIVFAPQNPNTPSQLWPHIAVSGDYLIVLANYTDSSNVQNTYVTKNGVRSPMVYSRYNFSTSSWTSQDLTLPGYDSTIVNETGGDIYSIDANGNNVAILAGGQYNSLVLWKSTDNGGNWVKTIIDTFPQFPYRFDKDTLYETAGNNGSVHVMLDNNGMAHVFTGLCQIKDSILDDKSFTYTFARQVGGVNDAILYWNEYTTGTLRTIATSLPVVGDSTIKDESYTIDDRSTGISNSTWPSAGVDAQGRIFLAYSVLVPLDLTTDGANYRDIVVTYSSDSGQTWNTPVNVTSYIGAFRQEMFPTIAKSADKLYISYLRSEFPGLTGTQDELYDINCLAMPTDMITNPTRVGLPDLNKVMTVGQLYPNPVSGSATIPVELKSENNVSVTIQNVMGQIVFSQNLGTLHSGTQQIQLETSALTNGIYFYSVQAGDMKASGKMIVKK